MLKFAALVQLRRGSTRLPDKIFLPIGEKPLIEHAVLRLKTSATLDEVIVATTTNPQDDAVEAWCNSHNVACFRGSEEDVLLRFVQAARKFAVENIVRSCGDNPFIDIELLDAQVRSHQKGEFDLTNVTGNNVLGSGVEVVATSALEKVERLAKKQAYREHVTPYFYEHPSDFALNFFPAPDYLGGNSYRITIDTQKDLELCRNVYNTLSPPAGSGEPGFIPTRKVVEYLGANPQAVAINQDVRQKNWREELKAEQ